MSAPDHFDAAHRAVSLKIKAPHLKWSEIAYFVGSSESTLSERRRGPSGPTVEFMRQCGATEEQIQELTSFDQR